METSIDRLHGKLLRFVVHTDRPMGRWGSGDVEGKAELKESGE